MDFDRLAARHKDAVYRQMVRACGNRDDAEDALVEALMAAYKALPQIRDEESFRGWLAVVGRRVCSRIQRREALLPVLSLSGSESEAISVPDFSADVAAHAQGRELTECVKSAISDLDKPLRVVYEMREIEGRSAEETAKQLGISIPATKSRLHRARHLVRSSLDQSVCGE